MSPKKSARSARAPARRAARPSEITWRPEHDELFRLAGADWARPRKVQVTTHTQGWTFVARMTMPNGTVVQLTTRVRRYADGRVFITREDMSLRLYVGGRPATQVAA